MSDEILEHPMIDEDELGSYPPEEDPENDEFSGLLSALAEGSFERVRTEVRTSASGKRAPRTRYYDSQTGRRINKRDLMKALEGLTSPKGPVIEHGQRVGQAGGGPVLMSEHPAPIRLNGTMPSAPFPPEAQLLIFHLLRNKMGERDAVALAAEHFDLPSMTWEAWQRACRENKAFAARVAAHKSQAAAAMERGVLALAEGRATEKRRAFHIKHAVEHIDKETGHRRIERLPEPVLMEEEVHELTPRPSVAALKLIAKARGMEGYEDKKELQKNSGFKVVINNIELTDRDRAELFARPVERLEEQRSIIEMTALPNDEEESAQ